MPTYPDWDRTALEIAWEHVDYLSMHYYAGNQANDTTSYPWPVPLPLNVSSTRWKAHCVTSRPSNAASTMFIFHGMSGRFGIKGDPVQGNWTEAPHLAEEIYNLEDALVVAQWLNVFLRKSHVLKIACVAQIVNVISWLHTRTDGMLKHPSYYAFKLVSNYARGDALDVLVKAPQVETKQYDAVSMLDVSASYDAETQKGAIFIVNRSETDSVTTDIVWQDGKTVHADQAWQMAGTDPKQVNTWESPDQLVAKAISAPKIEAGRATITLPPLSFTVLDHSHSLSGRVIHDRKQ